MERVKVISLAVVLVTWAVLLAFRFLTYPEPQRVPLKYTSGQTGSPQAAVIAAPVPTLIRWPPIRRPVLASPTPKNIFAPLPKPHRVHKPAQAKPAVAKAVSPPAPSPVVYIPPPPPPAPPPPSPEEVAAEQARRQRELAIQQARQQMTQYRFLGYLTENGEPQAFLGKGQDLFIVRNGEVLDGQIVVSAIDGTSVTLVVPTLAVTNKLELPK